MKFIPALRNPFGLLLAALLGTVPADAVGFSQMRGAGLIDKQGPGYYPPGNYRESDFQFLQKHGFNFVRLPLHYSFWTEAENPDQLSEAKLREIDEAIQWGAKYGQHVCLNFYSVPGYSVAEPKQQPSLWTDALLQKRFVEYWRAFATRYESIPPEQLSFNLLNEPDWDLPEAQYAPLMKRAIAAIREVDPDRPIVVDGLKAGRLPVMTLLDTGVVQAAHFYEPFPFTHYGAPWLPDSERLPAPSRWPAPKIHHHLFGPNPQQPARVRQNQHSPLVIQGPFAQAAEIRFKVGSVVHRPTQPLTVAILADGNLIAREAFAAPESAEADPLQPTETWMDREMKARIPAGTQTLEIWVEKGIRLTFRELGIRSEGSSREAMVTPLGIEWEPPTTTLRFVTGQPLESDRYYDRNWIQQASIEPWKAFTDRGGKVMVQEFGAYQRTPHPALLNYLKDCTTVWNESGWGWALWSLRGPMGILENGRSAKRNAGDADSIPEPMSVDIPLLQLLKAQLADPRKPSPQP